ncbi:hypothetical protein BCR42DRAFT_494452 [Absidia repens]|uniref:Plasma membrane fusion protein PRM1 n=1 Tax=Absidia repens TaxID=90262 RepID=A0A1X2I6D8_9FUNG|nr:hypothetical protein BCR42DRAFT_494452 [Absidia repens]
MNKLPIGVGGQYSVAWMNMATLVLVINIAALMPLYNVLDVIFQSAESQLQSVCTHVNAAADQIHQFPQMMHHYLQTIQNSILDHLRRAMIELVTVLQAVVLWFVDVYKSTYRCLIAFAINTALAIFTKIAAPLQKATEAIMNGIDHATDAIGRLFHLPDISPLPTHLSNWTSSMEDTQRKVNQWTNGTDQLHQWLSIPFDVLKQQINGSFVNQNNSISNVTSTTTSLSSPNTYCDATRLIEDLQDAHAKVKTSLNVIIGVLVAAIVLCAVCRVFFIRYRHQYLHRLRVRVLDQLAATPPPSNSTNTGERANIDRHDDDGNGTITQSTILARYGHAHHNQLVASVIYRSPPHAIVQPLNSRKRWLMFITQSTALSYCLCVSIVGLLTMYSFLALVRSSSSPLSSSVILRQLDANSDQWVQDTIQHTTQQIQQNIDKQWQTINQWITHSETMINEQLFGAIRSFAIPVNTTLDNVIQHLSGLITRTVGGTLMEEPAKEVINCLVLNKLDSVQQGVEWIASFM